jgi:FkbM family methyltransferase
MEVAEIFFDKIKNYIDPGEIKWIYDIGAGDCNESIRLTEFFENAKVFAFEANPDCIRDCAKRIVNNGKITLFSLCVHEYTGIVKFHPINQEKTVTTWKDGNPKASSIFRSNGTYELETYVQDELLMPCIRLTDVQQTFFLPPPDLIWMDLQGAELCALKGLGDTITKVKVIHTEIWGKETYAGQSLFPEMKEYLDELFICMHEPLPDGWIWADAEFIRKDIYDRKRNCHEN